MKRQYRVRWQRLGMSRPKVAVYESEAPARRRQLVLQGRMAEANPHTNPDAWWCCPGGWDCGCGGETWAQRWARESAAVPPLIMGPVIDSRQVGEWDRVAKYDVTPEPVPPDVVAAFHEGGGFWPIPEPVPAGEVPEDDVPF